MTPLSKQITFQMLETMFANIRKYTKWNIDGPLLWGYVFLDPSPEKLKEAAAELEALGYRIAGIEPVEEKEIFRLHIERSEAHTAASLHARNTEFYAFEERHALASYDGMKVGPLPSPLI